MSAITTTVTRWTLDPAHSRVGFLVRHLMITNIHGEFAGFGSHVTFDPAHPESTRIDATIDVTTLNTREPKRDADLKSPLFFDADKHAQMTFVSKSVHRGGENSVEVLGELTIRGVTREVILSVRDICGPQLDMHGRPRLGATASAKIKRSDFGMTWSKALETGGVVVGDLVTITLEASLTPAE